MRLPVSIFFLSLGLMSLACNEKKGSESQTDLVTLVTSVEAGIYSGVSFSASEQAAALDLVNRADYSVLNGEVGLNSRTAGNIVAARPIDTLLALDAVAYVGPVALQTIRAYLPNWTGQADENAALIEFVNHPSVTVEELDNIRYVGPAHALGIIEYRQLDPIDSLDELLAASASTGASPLADYQVESMRAYVAGWQPPDSGGQTHQPGSWYGVVFSGFEVGVVLDIVNHASLEVLDDEVGLDGRAAANIVNGRPIDSMDALAAVPYVATQAFQRLKAWIPNWNQPAPEPEPEPEPGQVLETSGVSFSLAEAEAVLNMANRAEQSLLDDEVGLDQRAAANIIAARPVADLLALDAVPYVGVIALERLKAFVPQWQAAAPGPDPQPEPGGGTYDGVEFSALEESKALEIANLANAAQLTEGGVSSSPRNIILNNRPWANLAAVAAFSGIGPASMQALKTMTATWQGPVDAPAQLSILQLVSEAANHGTASQVYGRLVQVQRALITSSPYTSSTGNTNFFVADPSAGNQQQLKVYIAATAVQNLAFASIFDDVQLTGIFDQYAGTFQIKLDDAQAHLISQNVSGLAYADYQSVQAAWHATAANPEGVVRVLSTFNYTYMVPLPIFVDHPMFAGNPPNPPQDSGNEQDHAWNAAAQQALDLWKAGSAQ